MSIALNTLEQTGPNETWDSQVHKLPFAERLAIWAARVWVQAHCAGKTSCIRLDSLFQHAKLEDCIGPFYSLFMLMAHGARRKLNIQCPCCRKLSNDERLLLVLITAHQQGNPEVAEGVLKDWLQPAAVRQAAYPAQLVAHGFLEAGLIFRFLVNAVDVNDLGALPCARTFH